MNRVNRILSLLFAAYMLVAMGGLSVFYHFCSCTNTLSSSVLIDESCCDNHIPDNSCCETTSAESCHSESENDCDCHTDIVVYKVEEATTALSLPIQVKDITLFVSADILFSFELLIHETPVSEFNSYSAPPLAGRDMVIAYQCIKIPPVIS